MQGIIKSDGALRFGSGGRHRVRVDCLLEMELDDLWDRPTLKPRLVGIVIKDLVVEAEKASQANAIVGGILKR